MHSCTVSLVSHNWDVSQGLAYRHPWAFLLLSFVYFNGIIFCVWREAGLNPNDLLLTLLLLIHCWWQSLKKTHTKKKIKLDNMRLHHQAFETKTFTVARHLDFTCTQGLSGSVTVSYPPTKWVKNLHKLKRKNVCTIELKNTPPETNPNILGER